MGNLVFPSRHRHHRKDTTQPLRKFLRAICPHPASAESGILIARPDNNPLLANVMNLKDVFLTGHGWFAGNDRAGAADRRQSVLFPIRSKRGFHPVPDDTASPFERKISAQIRMLLRCRRACNYRIRSWISSLSRSNFTRWAESLKVRLRALEAIPCRYCLKCFP